MQYKTIKVKRDLHNNFYIGSSNNPNYVQFLINVIKFHYDRLTLQVTKQVLFGPYW